MRIGRFLEFLLWSAVIGLIMVIQYQGFSGIYANIDYYTQAIRFKDLLVNFSWSERLFEQINYPTGSVISGNRAVDLLWFGNSLFFNDYGDLVVRVLMTGIATTFVCTLLLLFIFIFGTNSTLSPASRFSAILLLLVQKQIYPDFAFASPEIFLLLPVLLLVVSWWSYDSSKRQLPLVFMGLACALMCWINPEGLFFVHILLLALMIGWFMSRISTTDLLIFFGVFAGFVSLFWFVNPPYGGYKVVLLTRLSLYHVVMAWVFFVIINIFNCLPLHNASRKIAAFLCFVPVAAGAVYLMFGTQLTAIAGTYRDKELADLLANRMAFEKTTEWIMYLYPVLAVVTGVYLLFVYRYRNKVMVPLFILLSAFTAQHYFDLGSMLLIAMLAVIIISLLFQKVYERWQRPSSGFVLISVLFLCVEFAGLKYLPLAARDYGLKTMSPALATDVSALMHYRKGTVLSDSIYGSLILWYTSHNVVATADRINRAGIIAADKIWKSENIKEVWKLLNKHKIDYIFLPANYDEKYFAEPAKNRKKFYAYVLTGKDLPEWLKPLKHKDNPNVYLYKVKRNMSDEARANAARRETERLAAEREAAQKAAQDLDPLLLP
ncbi:MAG: hypothetical protein J6N49_04675 [Alphaproteobacteria bacterium]|nr:hypothetical protein [Alphaproteobacteria bacterium]